MSPRLNLRAAARPLVVAGSLWGGAPWSLAAPPIHVQDALLQPPRSAAPAQTAPPARGSAAPLPSLSGNAAPPRAALVAPGEVVYGVGYAPAGPPAPRQTPPPCAPDGVCISNPKRFGWYPTLWRTFPGDLPTGLPTEVAPTDQQATPDEDLGGPQEPSLQQEGSIVPPRGPRAESTEGGEVPTPEEGVPAAEAAPGEDAAPVGPIPGLDSTPLGPLPGLDVPPTGQPGPVVPPTGSPAGADPLSDPFGGGPPKPPAWLSRLITPKSTPPTAPPAPEVQTAIAIGPVSTEQSGDLAISPAALPEQPVQAAVVVEPTANETPPIDNLIQPAAVAAPVVDGPNLHGDDAPPALPAGLKGFSARRSLSGSTSTVQAAARRGGTESPITASRRVTPASAETPLGMPLVNPAAAAVLPPGDGGLQQAIYFEVSDQP